MKLIFVDNDSNDRNLKRIRDYATDELGWDVKMLKPSLQLSDTCLEIIKESHDTDVLMVDIGLTKGEEHELELLSKSHAKVQDPEKFGGMGVCLRISSELPNLPIVLFSTFDNMDLVRHVYWVGAKLFITKVTPSDVACNMLKSLSTQLSVREPCLADALHQRFHADSKPWENARVAAACDEYYKNMHGHRRFAILCAKMEVPFARVIPQKKAMGKFIRYMIESHDLMAVADRTVPDHIRHSGSVFFVGYYLLNSLPAFKSLETLNHYNAEAFHSANAEDRFEQLNLAWLLASLFHDSGYALEHSKSVVACLSRISGADLSHVEDDMYKGFDVAAEIVPLVNYCNRLGDLGKKVGDALSWITSKWNQSVPTRDGNKKRMFDHGVLSAARLLHLHKTTLPTKDVGETVLQAASAMALHNAAPLRELFPNQELSLLQEIPFSLFPIAALLALCDTFQIWDRELNDVGIPLDMDAVDTVERVNRAFINNSRVVRFDWKQSPGKEYVWFGDVHIKYSLQHGEKSEDVCESLKASITRWIVSERGQDMSKLFSLDSVVKVKVSYWIPRNEEPLIAEF